MGQPAKVLRSAVSTVKTTLDGGVKPGRLCGLRAGSDRVRPCPQSGDDRRLPLARRRVAPIQTSPISSTCALSPAADPAGGHHSFGPFPKSVPVPPPRQSTGFPLGKPVGGVGARDLCRDPGWVGRSPVIQRRRRFDPEDRAAASPHIRGRH